MKSHYIIRSRELNQLIAAAVQVARLARYGHRRRCLHARLLLLLSFLTRLVLATLIRIQDRVPLPMLSCAVFRRYDLHALGVNALPNYCEAAVL
ncbi:hypothetical protein BC834DRAFT_693851 [Gloeopeniophorella convolvens]|nr:hypothetical protein BC834DRAFT_693851 [Gloeopeniophorella convolvens]